MGSTSNGANSTTSNISHAGKSYSLRFVHKMVAT